MGCRSGTRHPVTKQICSRSALARHASLKRKAVSLPPFPLPLCPFLELLRFVQIEFLLAFCLALITHAKLYPDPVSGALTDAPWTATRHSRLEERAITDNSGHHFALTDLSHPHPVHRARICWRTTTHSRQTTTISTHRHQSRTRLKQ